MIFNIPQHKNCINCGRCCGLIPATPEEIEMIRFYLQKNKIKPINHDDALTCPFRNDDKKCCIIYPVRPMICKLMGVVEGMQCPNGNTANIDGKKFLPKNLSISTIINFIEW